MNSRAAAERGRACGTAREAENVPAMKVCRPVSLQSRVPHSLSFSDCSKSPRVIYVGKLAVAAEPRAEAAHWFDPDEGDPNDAEILFFAFLLARSPIPLNDFSFETEVVFSVYWSSDRELLSIV